MTHCSNKLNHSQKWNDFIFRCGIQRELSGFVDGLLIGSHIREIPCVMKIAIVINTSWNIYNFRLGFIKALQRAGHEVHTIAPLDEFTPHLVEAGCIHHNMRMDRRGANPIKDLALTGELFLTYLKVRPDIILHYTIKPNIYGTFAAALLGIPVINNVCGLGTVFLKKNFASAIAIALYKFAFLFPVKVFFQNQDDLNLFVSKKLISKSQADLLPGSGIDLNEFRPAEFKRNHHFTFLMISRLIIDKGVIEYIRAIETLRSRGIIARFQLLGHADPEHTRGIELNTIEEWIVNDKVEYLGTTNNVASLIANADCIVLPSYREGTPRALLEAACCAKPIVATDVPGCRQVVIDNFNGLLCKLKDADDLADKMENMLKMKDIQLKQLGENGRKLVERNYDQAIVIEKYINAIGKLRLAS
jgi:glycosyltransferase involved in cell wall biosynthesis